MKLKPWLFVALAVVIAGAAILALWQYRRFTVHTASDMVQALPRQDSAVFFVDVAALRTSGFLGKLSNSKIVQDPEYKEFVSQTRFNYEQDLDRVAGAVHRQKDGSSLYYLVLEGHFDWNQLSQYAKTHRGTCLRSVCTIPASKPGWWISYLPIHSNLMGLAYTATQQGAYDISFGRTSKPEQAVPAGFAWLTIPQAAVAGGPAPADNSPLSSLRSVLSLPKETTFSMTSVGDAASGAELHFEARLDSEPEALALETQLVRATELIRRTASEKGASKDAAALANVLSSGNFSRAGDEVTGTWVVSPAFLDAITQ